MPIRLLTIFRSVEWPEKRGAHVATCVNGSLLVIIGGMTNFAKMTSDGWIYDFTTMLWMKVLVDEMFVVFYDYVKGAPPPPTHFLGWLLGIISRKPSQIHERNQQLSKDQHYSSP